MESYTDNTKLPPGVGNSIHEGWERIKEQFLPLFLVVIVLSIVDSILGVSNPEVYDRPDSFFFDIFGMGFWLFIAPVFEYSADMMFVQAARGIRINVKDIIAGFDKFLIIVLTNLLVVALVGIAMVALIIPGIIVGCRLAFVSFLVMDKQLDPIAAVEASWKMTSGHGWKIFGLGLVSIFIFIGGFLLLIVGSLPAVMLIKASFASLYEAILQETDPGIFEPKPAVIQ